MIGGNVMTSILLAGDSFASNWHTGDEWWLQLPYSITNTAQAGASQFKILKQFDTIDISKYDAAIIFHTSPYRIYSESENLLHKKSITHKNSCYVINDVLHKRNSLSNAMKNYVKYFYNEEFVKYTHKKICQDIENITSKIPTIHASGFDYSDIYSFENFISVQDLFENHRGNTCHLNKNGNRYLAERICKKLHDLLP